MPSTPADIVVQGMPEVTTSIKEQLVKERQRSLEATVCYIDVPGYGGRLVASYRMMDGKELEIIGKRVERQAQDQAEKLVWGSCDILIAACMGFFLRGDDDKLYPLVADGNPVKYDENLADFLEYKSEAKSARAVVQGLFTNKDMALVQHQIRYTRWMADPSKDPNSEGDLLGEL
jgi:hypothetical protein